MFIPAKNALLIIFSQDIKIAKVSYALKNWPTVYLWKAEIKRKSARSFHS